MQGERCKCCGAVCVCVCERCKCCVDCGVVYVSGVSAVVCARLQLFDKEPFAVLSGIWKKPTHRWLGVRYGGVL